MDLGKASVDGYADWLKARPLTTVKAALCMLFDKATGADTFTANNLKEFTRFQQAQADRAPTSPQ